MVIRSGVKVPMFIRRPPRREARSEDSEPLRDMMGDEEVARQMLALKFCTTVLVMLWERGVSVRWWQRSSGREERREETVVVTEEVEVEARVGERAEAGWRL